MVLTTGHASPAPMLELAQVKARRHLHRGNDRVSKGARGTIVHVYQAGEAFEVEFIGNPNVVLTLYRDDIETA